MSDWLSLGIRNISLRNSDMFEVEFRARFSEEKYQELMAFLQKNAKSLGNDDKDVYYFILPDRLFKLVNNTSKKAAKMSLKMNRIGEGAAFEEIEAGIAPDQFEKAVKLVKGLGLTTKIIHEPQKRDNFIYKECEIALKHSKTWGHHLEIEQMVADKSEQASAEERIRTVATELGVKLMTEEELKEFVRSTESKL
jgi:predicted adenylyl cyclase CyaB